MHFDTATFSVWPTFVFGCGGIRMQKSVAEVMRTVLDGVDSGTRPTKCCCIKKPVCRTGFGVNSVGASRLSNCTCCAGGISCGVTITPCGCVNCTPGSPKRSGAACDATSGRTARICIEKDIWEMASYRLLCGF